MDEMIPYYGVKELAQVFIFVGIVTVHTEKEFQSATQHNLQW